MSIHPPFDAVFLIDTELSTATAAAVDELERRLNMPLPLGYREYVRTLGCGTFCDLVSVTPPQMVGVEEDEPIDWHQMCWSDDDGKHFFWERGCDVLSYEEVLESNIFGFTDDGDYILQHAKAPQRPFILPRHGDTVYWMPEGFLGPMEWHSAEGVRRHTPETLYFQPTSHEHRYIELFCQEAIDLAKTIDVATNRWHAAGRQVLEGPGHLVMLTQAIGGRIQITYSDDDERIGIRIGYLGRFASKAEQLATELQGLGYFETGRSRK